MATRPPHSTPVDNPLVNDQDFSQASEYFRQKIKLPTASWTDIWERQHSQAFVVAGAQHDALLEDLYNAVAQARTDGGYGAFKESFPEIVGKHGWAHNGSPGWRSRVIYGTNTRQAYNAGRYQQMVAIKHLRPYWRYRHNSTEHPRLTHQAWDGLILLADDPWFAVHMPQNGWGCNCSVESLSKREAQRHWEAAGKPGPDTAPPIVWREVRVGTQGATPRTVRVPDGVDPGFAHNPAQGWLEPHTVPPLDGYEAVLKVREESWPTGFTPPAAPTPKVVPPTALLPPGTPPEQAVGQFLEVFGATMTEGAAFEDAAGSAVAVSRALFSKKDASGGAADFKWLAAPSKADRLESIYLLALTLAEPDEIWWAWEQDRADAKRWRLRRRYLKAFEIEGAGTYGVGAFEWGRDGWTGSTLFMTSQAKQADRAAYFDRQRIGRLLYSVTQQNDGQ